ncbi:MAG: FKBP-type peptidyl-prolyl cis-trans isomerase [Solirubrobacterales bacterium]
MRGKTPILAALAALTLVLAIAGCGGGSSSATTSGSGATGSQEKTSEEESAFKENAAGEYIAETSEGVPQVTVPKGPPPKKLVVEDLKQGKGATAKAGDKVTVHYVGVVYKTKEQFDANWENEPFSFKLGAQEVIPGWDKGVPGMKVGGRRKLTIPPALAYGSQGVYPSIPPNSTLVFVIELLRVK